jgi:hypothetical protein
MLLLNLKRVESTLNKGGACNGYGAATGVAAPRGALHGIVIDLVYVLRRGRIGRISAPDLRV